MREAVHRLFAPMVAWIPDVSGQPARRQAAVGLVASILFHLLLFAAFLLIALLFPPALESLPPLRNDPLEITLVPAPEREQKRIALAEKRTPMIDPRGLQASTQKPANPQFESDRDMVAGSELPANGLLPLPSQEGRDDRPTRDFATQDVVIGLTQPAPASPTQPAAEAPKPDAASAPPALRPLYDPQPVPKAELAKAETAAPNQPIPIPATTPVPRSAQTTPPRLKISDESRPDSVAVARAASPAPITRLEPAPQTTPAPKTAASPTPRWMAMLATPAPMPGPSFKQRYQESLARTRIEGAISNRGKAGVDAVATPIGRYWMQVKQAIGSGWTPLVQQRMSVIAPGSARVAFVITSEGKPQTIRIESNSSNSSFADLCEEAVRRAPIPPPPPDIVPTLRDGQLEYSITFTFYTL